MLGYAHDTRHSRECPSPTHTLRTYISSLQRVGRAGLSKTSTHAGKGGVDVDALCSWVWGLGRQTPWKFGSTRRARMRAPPPLHLFDPAPARGSLSAHRSHAPSLCPCLPHGTRGVACRPRGCSLRRQPMLRKRQQPSVFIAVRSHVDKRNVRLRTRHQALEQARVPESL